MNKTIQIQLKYILLFAVVFLLLIYFSFIHNSKLPEDKVEEKVTITETIIKEKDSAKVNLKPKVPKEKIAFLVDSITKSLRKKPTKKEVQNNKVSPKKPTEKEVEAFVYQDTTKLKNATVVSRLVSPCAVLDLDFKVLTENKSTTIEKFKKVTKYRVPNVWFINFEPKFTVFPNPAIIGGAVSVDYTIKNKFRLGAGVEFNTLLPKNQQFIANFKIGFSL